MAVTKILARRGGLAQAIAYVVNGDKTEEQVLTATQGCSIKSACAEMQDAKIRWNKTDGVQLYHIIQSFRPGEITPELALEIAQEFVREHLPGYQAVIGIHTDREHIHAHIAFNSINQLTGEKYHSIPNCGRMNPNTARQVSKSEAEAMGYGPCSKCY